VVFAPAFQFLWSDLDRVGMHYRRYTAASFKKLLSKSQYEFNVLKDTYVNFFLFPYIALIRILQKLVKSIHTTYNTASLTKPPALVNHLLKGIFSSEKYLLSHLNFPFGVSYLCILERR